jgi:trehalose synthase
MTDLAVEHLGAPSSEREARAIRFSLERAQDTLAGRTVWCVSAIAAGRAPARTLREHLDGAGVVARRFETAADETLHDLAERLDAMLSSVPVTGCRLSSEDEELFLQEVQHSEALLGDGVRPDDVVVLHDPLTAMLAEAVRDRGAHVIWHGRASASSDAALVAEVEVFPGSHRPAIDAYVMTRQHRAGPGRVVEHVVALMPAPDLVSFKEIVWRPAAAEHLSDVGWSSILADVVGADRGECVGGTVHARPAVARR